MEISDRGRGVDVAAALAARSSIGLAGLQDPAQLVAGRLEICSQPVRGTRVLVQIPLTSAVVVA